MVYRHLVFPVLSRFDAETVHDWTMRLASVYGNTPLLPRLVGRILIPTDPRLRVNLPCGLEFRSPIGVAAGFDKFGIGVCAFASLGYSHVEVGTVTLMPQEGNPKPRLFRLIDDRGLINGMGFNNPGVVRAERNLAGAVPVDFVVGISVGANRTSVESGQSIIDFVAAAKLLAHRGHYIALNVSSPNTEGLRDLQHKDALSTLLDELLKARAGFFPDKPVLVKIAPDLTDEQLDDILEVITSHDIAGIIATNTTFSREGLTSPNRDKPGGMSGPPLLNRAMEVVRYIYRRTDGGIPIIGVGGISTWEDAVSMIKAGASVLQILTAIPYVGPLAAPNINRGLSTYMDRKGIQSIREIIGVGD